MEGSEKFPNGLRRLSVTSANSRRGVRGRGNTCVQDPLPDMTDSVEGNLGFSVVLVKVCGTSVRVHSRKA
jgi:hypothetical protein